jgi:hypothetical protein
MSLLNEETPNITLTFSLPPDFIAPLDGDSETIIDIQVANANQPIKVKNWRYPSITDGQFSFSFAHHYLDISVKYRINIQMFHNQQPLLLEQDYFVIVNHAPYHQTLHLSPIGYLYVEVQEPKAVAAEQAVTVSLHETGNPEVELVRVTHDEQTATSFYLKYDPDDVVPGKRYALSGIENRYHQRISVSPGPIELLPTPQPASSRLLLTLNQWLDTPLRLFTDTIGKIR